MTTLTEAFFSHLSSAVQCEKEESILEVDLQAQPFQPPSSQIIPEITEAEEDSSHHAISKLLIHSVFEHNKMVID